MKEYKQEERRAWVVGGMVVGSEGGKAGIEGEGRCSKVEGKLGWWGGAAAASLCSQACQWLHAHTPCPNHVSPPPSIPQPLTHHNRMNVSLSPPIGLGVKKEKHVQKHI